MNSKCLVAFGLVLFVIVSEVSGRPCTACGFGEGTDFCKNCNSYYVRPVPVERTKIAPFRSSGPESDVCTCSKDNVHPVALPKPKYIWTEKKTKSESCDNRPLIPAPAHLHDFGHEEEEYLVDTSVLSENTACGFKKPLYPVDAVSIDLVNKLQQNAAMTIPEEKLQYGFWKLPKEIPNYKVTQNIPEEKLYTVERQIVELKHPRQIVKCGSGCDDQIVLEDKEPQPIAYLSYRDLGFVPEAAFDRKFVPTCDHHHHHHHHKSEEEKPILVESEEEYIVRRDGGSEEIDYEYRVSSDREDYDYVKKPRGSCGCH